MDRVIHYKGILRINELHKPAASQQMLKSLETLWIPRRQERELRAEESAKHEHPLLESDWECIPFGLQTNLELDL